LRLIHPVSKSTIIHKLETEMPSQIGGESVVNVSNLDGIKYIFADDSWLLIRPSGTEPVLRVYAEGRTQEMVTALLEFGEGIASSVV
jgi:phosphomannomutase